MGDNDQALVVLENKEEPKPNVIAIRTQQLMAVQTLARFRGRLMLLVDNGNFPHFVPCTKELFKDIAYQSLGAMTRGQVSDVFEFASSVAPDLSESDRYVLFGTGNDEGTSGATQLWDKQKLRFVQVDEGVDYNSAVWRSPYGVVPRENQRLEFLMGLAGRDEGLYDDIMQSLAPLVMEKKPDGVVWWVGAGANGKSTLMDAIYRIFPGQLSSLSVKQLTDERDTPSLNGTMANVVKESSEGRIDDTHIYKSIGTHEDFSVHKFHSQESVTIRGNMHHIFSGNSIPTFNDKGHSARRRTFIVPFLQEFESDPTFEEKTFTPEFFGRLINEMCLYAARLERQGYNYQWSSATINAKLDYDVEANNAEEYVRQVIRESGLAAFDNFDSLLRDYENWCGEEGYVPLQIKNFRRAVLSNGFERITRDSSKIYCRTDVAADDQLTGIGLSRPGLYTKLGFVKPLDDHVDTPVVPEFEAEVVEPEAPRKTILENKW